MQMMKFMGAVRVFSGHFDTYPPQTVLSWNTFVPTERDLSQEFITSLRILRDHTFPRGRDTLALLTPEERESLLQTFRSLNVHFSLQCAAGEFELVPSGKDIQVTEENFLDFAHRVEELYRCFRHRQIAFITTREQPAALAPLVPASVPTAGEVTGRVDLVQVIHSEGEDIPALQWVRAQPIDYTSSFLPGVQPTCPTGPAAAQQQYLPSFVFCRMGNCLVGRCLGWAPAASAAVFQRQLALQADPAPGSGGGGGGGAPSGSPGSSHIGNLRELRNGHLNRLGGNSSQAAESVFGAGSVSTTTDQQEAARRRKERVDEEMMRSQFMRENAIPFPTTARDIAMFSPTHEECGLFAPIQASNW